MRHLYVAALASLAVAVTASATASATTGIAARSGCRPPAVISTRVGVIDHNFTAPPNASGSFASPLGYANLRGGHVYQLGRVAATIRFGSVKFKVAPGSVVSLTCFGQVVHGPLLPALRLQSGAVTAYTTASHPGGVVTGEALSSPAAGYSRRLTFKVSRRPSTRGVSEKDMFLDSRRYLEAPLGTTTVTTLKPGYTNITPYVGKKPGTCRHADGAALKSTGRSRRNFVGTARYVGLH